MKYAPVSRELHLVHLLLCALWEVTGAGKYVIKGLFKMEILLHDSPQHAHKE